MTVTELAERYIEAMDADLIMGKGGRHKRPSTFNQAQLEEANMRALCFPPESQTT